MAKRLNDNWKNNMFAKITEFKASTDPEPIELVTALPLAKSWLVMELTRQNVPFAVHTLGGGVSKITTDTALCPKCKGTGRVAKKEGAE